MISQKDALPIEPALPEVVLIHGSGRGVTDFDNWNGVIPALAEHFHGFEPDMVGFGYTDVPEDVTDFTLDFWVGHIIGFLDALGISQASFIGNSYGGALRLAVAARPPERVRRFALMAAAGLQFEMSAGLLDVWGYTPSDAHIRKLMQTFTYN